MSDLALFGTALYVPSLHSITGGDNPRVRRDSPATSHAAADSNNVGDSRAIVLDAFHRRAYFADHELVEFLAYTLYTPQRIRTARAELAEAGLLELANYTTTTPSGRQARVFTLRKDAA